MPALPCHREGLGDEGAAGRGQGGQNEGPVVAGYFCPPREEMLQLALTHPAAAQPHRKRRLNNVADSQC